MVTHHREKQGTGRMAHQAWALVIARLMTWVQSQEPTWWKENQAPELSLTPTPTAQ